MNPILVQCLGLGYFFNMYRNKPLVRPGRRADPVPPGAVGVPPGAPPELRRLLRRGAGRDDRPGGHRGRSTSSSTRTDPWYRHLYRNCYAYHGVHPFYMWYWGAHALDHLGDVIFVGGRPESGVPHGLPDAPRRSRTRWRWRARRSGSSPRITYLHTPPLTLADVQVSDAPRADGRARAGATGWRVDPRGRLVRRGRPSRGPPRRAASVPDRVGPDPGRPGPHARPSCRYGFKPLVWTQTEPTVEGLDRLRGPAPPGDRSWPTTPATWTRR